MIKKIILSMKSNSEILIKKYKNISKPNFNFKLLKTFHEQIKNKHNDLEEMPNLSYIKSLSSADAEFHNKFLKTLSEEYTSDLRAYVFCIENGAPRAAASNVNKLKDKLNILGMKKAFSFAERHQKKLQKGNKSYDRKFKKILAKADRFLTKQEQIYKLVN